MQALRVPSGAAVKSLAVSVAIAWSLIGCASHNRSAAAREAFRRGNPCPATLKTVGPCPGWVVDHRVPLCAGGADAPPNMQWQRRPESLVKDAEERRTCRALRDQGVRR
jgi:hypothetical protein